VNADLTPALIAAGGGMTMIAGITAREQHQDQVMRKERVRLVVRFPVLDATQAKAACSSLAGLSDRLEVIFETATDASGIHHAIWLPASARASITSMLTAVMPGLRVAEEPSPQGRVTLSLKVFVPTPAVLVTENPESAVRTLLAGLGLTADEAVVIRWAARPSLPPQLRDSEPVGRAAKEVERAWRQKTSASGGGFQMAGLVLIRAASMTRARGLAEHVASSFRSRRSVGALRITSERGGRSLASLPRTTRSSGWLNTSEIVSGLLGWPLGEEAIPGIERAVTRQIPPHAELARDGRPLFVAEHRGEPRPVALSREAALRHVAVLGASGGGKSTILAAGVLSHIAAGDGGILIDPKGDLVADVVARADKGAERIVVLDPSAPVVPGVDLFAGGDPDLRAEVLLSIFRSLFRDAWGPRIDSYLRLALRTLAEAPGSSLLDLPQLFLDVRARRRAVGFLRDPLLIGQWEVFDQLSEAERMQHIQAPLSRILSLVTRPPVQAVFGPDPRLDVAQLLRDRGWLLVPLSSGVIGTASARIIGSALTFIAWSHISSRAAIPQEQRRPLFLFFDELQALTDQGLGLEDLLEQSRGYGASVTIATQAIGRTPEQIRHSLLSNVGTLISLRAGGDESARIARELPGIAPRDIQSLPPYEVVARVATGQGSGSIVVTGRTEPLGAPTGQGERIRERSAEQWGRSRQEIQAAIRERYGMTPHATDTIGDVGRTRRHA
jgi:DNA helicase HerA-like ATPase